MLDLQQWQIPEQSTATGQPGPSTASQILPWDVNVSLSKDSMDTQFRNTVRQERMRDFSEPLVG